MDSTLDSLLEKAHALLQRLERLLTAAPIQPYWNAACTFRWDHPHQTLHPVTNFQRITLSDLLGIEPQKQRIQQNTLQFVQGDTSTNDALMLIATSASNAPAITDFHGAGFAQLQTAIIEVATLLAQAIVRDGEGATKFITVKVEGGKSEAECK